MDSVDDIILGALANACKVERAALAPETVLADVGFDSLGAAAFVSEMEFSHGIVIEPDDLPKLYLAVTPADLVAVVGIAHAKAVDPELRAAT
jgi:acyl carrier protein